MSHLTLVQKRALLAAANNVHKKERVYTRAFRESINPSQNTRQATRQLNAAVANLNKAGELLYRLAEKLGVNANATNYRTMRKNVISNVMKKGFGPRLEHKIWLRGYEAEMERARANFRNFEKGVFHQKINLIGESHRKKTPSPPKRVSPPRRTSPTPANNAHRRVHGIGPANNTRITWSRNANGKISIHKTLRNLNLGLTNALRNAISKMSENQAMNTIRQLARRST
jgi:hypothetical protein